MIDIKSQIKIYLDEIIKWNKKINLVSFNDLENIYNRHYLDSISILNNIPENSRLLDMGSGNGFPSIPIAIHRPDVDVFSIEIKRKKAFFLENIKNKINLNNLTILNISIDDNPYNFISFFDVITSRAFRDINLSIEKAFFYIKNNGKLIYFNSFNNNVLHCISRQNEKVIHNVNNIVYKLENGNFRSISEIFFNKDL